MNLPGMANLQKQVAKMQEDMVKMQDQLDAERLETSSNGGVVKVVTSGMGELISIDISKEIIDPEDAETLSDLVTVAVRDAMKQAQDHHTEKMGAITGGLAGRMPGLGLPL
jgi:DNA-binding YbaB/EbfC family protein